MTKHTPGPWFVHDFSKVNEGDPSNITVSCTTPDHITVANMGMGLTGKREEWEANARLIAAAPELLEALETLAEYYQYLMQSEAVYDKAMLAIRKAKGEGATEQITTNHGWVGLTDEELVAVLNKTGEQSEGMSELESVIALLKAIEAKLKEKNT